MMDFSRFDSIMSLIEYFPTEHSCKQFLAEERWGKVVVCPYCGSVHVYTCKNDRVEGFWSHFRRSIFGMYHHVSVKYLQAYIDEMVMRLNTRKASEGTRFELMLSRSLKVVNYRTVTSRNSILDTISRELNDRLAQSLANGNSCTVLSA